MTQLPDQLPWLIEKALQSIGDNTGIKTIQDVPGGCINHGACLTTQKGVKYFLKWNSDPQIELFTSEAYGLKLIASTHTIRVPTVYYVMDSSSNPAFILLEWIQASSSSIHKDFGHMGSPAVLGEQLASLHHNTSTAFGLEKSNYLGSTPQINQWKDRWVDFFRENRLHFQYKLAEKNHLLSVTRRQRLEKLMDNLERWLGSTSATSALLHGDLWTGNCIAGPQNQPVLIDPAVYYGNREAEIAYTELFGGFDPRFYAAYQSAWPLDPGYKSRKDLYNLYHLLNHMNIFGGTYAAQVDSILSYYIG